MVALMVEILIRAICAHILLNSSPAFNYVPPTLFIPAINVTAS